MNSRARAPRALARLATVAVLAACSSRSPGEATKKEVDTFTSWAATTHLIADRWLADAVPDRFATQSLRRVAETLRQELKKSASQPIPKEVQARLRAAVSAIDGAASAMRSAIEERHRSTVAEQVGRLSAAQRALAELSKREPAS
jgi:hypothetical protein